jgi:hypothetical protein
MGNPSNLDRISEQALMRPRNGWILIPPFPGSSPGAQPVPRNAAISGAAPEALSLKPQSRISFVERDRQTEHALSGGTVDRVRDRRRSSDNADFTDAFDAEWIDFVVLLFDEDHVDCSPAARTLVAAAARNERPAADSLFWHAVDEMRLRAAVSYPEEHLAEPATGNFSRALIECSH